MKRTTKIIVSNDFDKPKILWLEPWGADYTMMPNEEFEIIEEESTDDFYFHIVFSKNNDLLVWAEGSEVTYPIVSQNGKELDCGHNRIE